MQIARGRRRVWLLAAALTAIWAAAMSIGSVGAQDAETHRFFGFSGDVTIDDQALEAGDEIVAMADGREIGRTTVNRAGAWILDVNSGDFTVSPCNVSFVVEGLSVDPQWDSCKLRVRLALSSPAGAESDEQSMSESGDSAMSDNETSEQAADEMESDESEDQLEAEQSETEPSAADEREIVRPAPPRTGTGGAAAASEAADWVQAAALTALLMFVIAVAAMLLSSRTDSR